MVILGCFKSQILAHTGTDGFHLEAEWSKEPLIPLAQLLYLINKQSKVQRG